MSRDAIQYCMNATLGHKRVSGGVGDVMPYLMEEGVGLLASIG